MRDQKRVNRAVKYLKESCVLVEEVEYATTKWGRLPQGKRLVLKDKDTGEVILDLKGYIGEL